MAQVPKIDSNVTGLRWAEEASLKTLPVSPVWYPLEPNTYSDPLGGQVTTVARDFINDSRQRRKGSVTDLDASGGIVSDITQTNLADLFQGLFFAAFRRKAEYGVTSGNFSSVAASDDSYNAASGLNVFLPGDLVYASTFTNSVNNGLKLVVTSAAGKITVSSNLADESPAAGVGALVQVGYQFDTGDAVAVAEVTGTSFPKITTTTKDCTELGLIPGEWVYIGGDQLAERFDTDQHNGFCRVRSVSVNEIVFDKTAQLWTGDAGTGKTIRIFFGRVLKNEVGSNIVRKTYQIERTLGAPDDTSPAQIQSEYLTGAVFNMADFDVQKASKPTVDLKFVACDHEQRTGVTGLKSGIRPSLVETDAFNTSSDVSRIKLAQVVPYSACPPSLFSYVEELKWSVNNNMTPDKAIGTLGAFDMTTGTFQVSGSLQAYFATVEAISAVRNNIDVSFDLHFVKRNAGISVDMPLVALGDGRANVEKDVAIKVPLSFEAATAISIDSNLNHTMLMVFWDYLPTRAE